MDVVSQSLKVQRGSSLHVYSQQVERAAAGLLDTIEPLRQAAKYEAENIGHAVNQVVSFFIIVAALLAYDIFIRTEDIISGICFFVLCLVLLFE